MRSRKTMSLIFLTVLMASLNGCMAWTDGMDTMSGTIYTDYNPFGSAYFGPGDYYSYYNYPYAGPMLPPPSSRPVFGYPAWGGHHAGSLNRPNSGPVNRPGTTPPSGGSGSGSPSVNGQRPGANVTVKPSAPSAGGASATGARPNRSTRR